MKMEQTESSETLAYKIQTPENYPEENIQHREDSESLKSRIFHFCCLEHITWRFQFSSLNFNKSPEWPALK
jgi:hypothetical protein